MSLSKSRLQEKRSTKPSKHLEDEAKAIPKNWSSLVGGSQAGHHEDSFASRMARQDAVAAEEAELKELVKRKSFASYYSTNCDDLQYKHLIAADVRRQVRQAPSEPYSRGNYPHEYRNRPTLPLRAEPNYTEFPMKPSPSKGDRGNNYCGGNPGPVRAFYNDADREVFDVGYHDTSRPGRESKNGRG